MVKHKRLYLTFFGYTVADWVPCENCFYSASEFHHLIFKSLGGKDDPVNVMALCVSTPDRAGCHNRAHIDRKFNEHLKRVHKRKYDAWVGSTGKDLQI